MVKAMNDIRSHVVSIMEVIESDKDMKEGTYLQLCDLLQKLYVVPQSQHRLAAGPAQPPAQPPQQHLDIFTQVRAQRSVTIRGITIYYGCKAPPSWLARFASPTTLIIPDDPDSRRLKCMKNGRAVYIDRPAGKAHIEDMGLSVSEVMMERSMF